MDELLCSLNKGEILNISLKDIHNIKGKSKFYNTYTNDLIQILENINIDDKDKNIFFEKRINLKYGDNTNSYKEKYFAKACKVGDDKCCLLPLNINRHYGKIEYVLKNDTIDFKNKKPVIFWRGVTTNYGYDKYENITLDINPRLFYVKNYFNHKLFDIGFNKLCQSVDKYDYIHKYLKKSVSIDEMFQYKYLLSLEGNDVATNLKWILASNSICFMPKPTKITFFREDLLKPDVNYIEIDDTNILQKFQYCEQNPDFCLKIIENNKKLMSEFMNKNLYLEGSKILKYNILKDGIN
jgi:hypothetical protein